MRQQARYQPPESAAQLDGLKKIFRKVAPIAAAAAAVATGQPQLAIPAAAAARSVAGKKKVALEPPAPPIEPQGGFLDNLLPADRNALLIGGALVGTLLLSKVLFRK